jgi:galactose mutarotase-like enzyme
MTAVTIANAYLTAVIAPKGAELQSLIPAGGQDAIWPGDPAVWPWRAPNLFPIVGALVDDTLVHEGRRYPIKQHGFLRHSLCDIAMREPDACVFRLTDSEETKAQYPFAFALTIGYRLADDRLECSFTLHNPAAVPLYASLGAHPAFRWPLTDAPREAHAVLFARDEPEPIRRLTGGLIDPVLVTSPVHGRILPLRDSLFDDDALIFDRLVSRKVTFGAPGGPSVELDFPDFPNLGIWTKPKGTAPFLCIEPWQGMASPAGFAGEFSQKPGVVTIAPGDTRIWRYSIRPLMAMPHLSQL